MKLLKVLIKKSKIANDDTGLIFLLHGYGSNEKDLFSFSEFLPENNHIISFQAPTELEKNCYSWYDIYFNNNSVRSYNISQAKESIKIVYNNIMYYSKLYNKIGKITLIGFSQGAILSWSLGISYADKINKIALLSGYFNEELISQRSNNLEKLKCFISHGEYDPVIPIEMARDSIKKTKKFNLNYVFKEYPEAHGVSNQNLTDLIDWLSI
tara:strand:- start:408 stop:1040 length:633 start_codon:yes stop_codon:yes gene_type:complete